METPSIVNRLHKSVSNSPLICFVLGGASLFLGTCSTLVDIRTTENLILNIDPSKLVVSWDVMTQPYEMLAGGLDITHEMAYVAAWGVEITQLIFGIGLVVAMNKLHSISPTLAKWFGIIGLILLGINAWANIQSSGGLSLMSVLMAIVIGGFAIIGLPLGIGFIEHAFGEI